MSLSNSARQSIFVFSGTLTSRILGFIRLVLIGTTLGYTRLADSYTLANETPNMMYELMLGSLIASTMLPFFVEQYKRKDKKADEALMSFVFVSALALTLLTLILAPFLADFMTSLNTSSTANAQRNLVIFFLMFFLPQIFFYALTSAMQAFLHARSRFVAAAFAPIVNNIVVIAALLYIRNRIDEFDVPLSKIQTLDLTFILALATTLGVALITVILSFTYKSAGGSFKVGNIRHPNVRSLITRSKWMVGYAVANQIALFIIIAFANSIQGGVVMYLVAWSFFQLPHGLIANSIITTMVPRITHTLEVAKTDINEIATTKATALITRQSSTGLFVLMATFSALTISVATPALVLLISHGNISVDEGKHTARVLIAFISFLPAFSLYLFNVRLANSFNQTKLAFYINVLQNLLNVTLAFFLKEEFTTVGLAFAFSFSYFLVLPISLKVTSNYLTEPVLEKKTCFVSAVTAVVAAICGYFVSVSISNTLLGATSAALVCLFVLLIGSLLIKSELVVLKNLVYSKRERDNAT